MQVYLNGSVIRNSQYIKRELRSSITDCFLNCQPQTKVHLLHLLASPLLVSPLFFIPLLVSPLLVALLLVAMSPLAPSERQKLQLQTQSLITYLVFILIFHARKLHVYWICVNFETNIKP